jgi:protocatechuate 3,4-dioxygenase alpha subunit
MIPTPGQTVGPFFGYALPYAGGPLLVPTDHPDAVVLHGRVLDGAGDPVPDALLELWQAGPDGQVAQQPGSLRRGTRTFTGWGRAETDPDGHYSFTTLAPGAPATGGRFFALNVFARGLLDGLFTRAYLPGSEHDPFLESLAPERRATLLAAADDGGYRFDVRLQGDAETVFLTYPRQ